MDRPFPHLNRAPIREALLDIQVTPKHGVLEALQTFTEELRETFPLVEPLQTMEAQFDLSGDEPSARSTPPQAIGYICWNSARTRAVQARVDGFTVNQVRGYASWDVLRAEATPLWERYAALVEPDAAVRFALRYINRLELPVNQDLTHWLRTRAEIAPELPQLIDNYFTRVELSFGREQRATLVQASEPANGTDMRGLIFDIDVVSLKRLPPSDSAAIWTELSELRTIKNRCFFQSLHPDLVETYK